MRWRRVVRVVAMRLIRILIAASFVASFLVFPVRTASACSCEEAPPDAVALRRSDVVFSGTATGGLFLSGNRHRTSFDVEAVYRGSAHSVQSVQSGSGNGDCGYRASRAEPATSCSRSGSVVTSSPRASAPTPIPSRMQSNHPSLLPVSCYRAGAIRRHPTSSGPRSPSSWGWSRTRWDVSTPGRSRDDSWR